MKQINQNLTDEQKHVLFNRGTEKPFTDPHLTDFSDGEYRCINCQAVLFDAKTKYESTERGLVGWPSFDKAFDGALRYEDDLSLGTKRTEVLCANCGVHLGHVFDADDAPSGTHFCINSVALNFQKK